MSVGRASGLAVSVKNAPAAWVMIFMGCVIAVFALFAGSSTEATVKTTTTITTHSADHDTTKTVTVEETKKHADSKAADRKGE